jgi:plasmid stabilization system protein ParE
MSYALVHSTSFKADLRRVAARDPWRIDDLVAALEAASLLLRRFPELGHPVQIKGAWSMTRRSWRIGETGYLIRYTLQHEKKRIVLTRFRHQAQRPLKR